MNRPLFSSIVLVRFQLISIRLFIYFITFAGTKFSNTIYGVMISEKQNISDLTVLLSTQATLSEINFIRTLEIKFWNKLVNLKIHNELHYPKQAPDNVKAVYFPIRPSFAPLFYYYIFLFNHPLLTFAFTYVNKLT